MPPTWDGKERREEKPMEQLKEKINDIAIKLELLIQRFDHLHTSKNIAHDQMTKMLMKHNDILYGETNIEEGINYRLRLNTEFREFWQRFGWLILAGFAGVPCTVIAGIFLYAIKGS